MVHNLNPSIPNYLKVSGNKSKSKGMLKDGCYFFRFIPTDIITFHFEGTLRVQQTPGKTYLLTADLYKVQNYKMPKDSIEAQVINQPTTGEIPIYPRDSYQFYFKAVGITRTKKKLKISFEKYGYIKGGNPIWTESSDFRLEVPLFSVKSWETPAYEDGRNVGMVNGHWISKYVRATTIEIDKVGSVKFPKGNGNGETWESVFCRIGWKVKPIYSQENIPEPSGKSWSAAELHKKLINRDSGIDCEWRYHLLCVKQIDKKIMGIPISGVMYDQEKSGYADLNDIPREGAAVAHDWVFPSWCKKCSGKKLGETDDYFRVALHEIGHAMGLQENNLNYGIMGISEDIAHGNSNFPYEIDWCFTQTNKDLLGHLADAMVRPGMIKYGGFDSRVFTWNYLDVIQAEALQLEIDPVFTQFPYGAPVRLNLELKNTSDVPILAPEYLGLKSPFLTGIAKDFNGKERRFRSIIKGSTRPKVSVFDKYGPRSHSISILSGPDGPLFPVPGSYEITIQLQWTNFYERLEVQCCGKAKVNVSLAEGNDHLRIAQRILEDPELLSAIVLGGDEQIKRSEGLQMALENPILQPHYSYFIAKNKGSKYFESEGDPVEVSKNLENIVRSKSEDIKLKALLSGNDESKDK